LIETLPAQGADVIALDGTTGNLSAEEPPTES